MFESDEIISTTSTTNANNAFSILVHGRGLGRLSTKIAMKHRRSTVITMKYQADDRDAHLSLTNLLGIQNNLLCEHLVDAAIARKLMTISKNTQRKEQPFRYGVLSLDVFEDLIRTAQVRMG